MTYLKFLFMCITLTLPQLSNAGEADAASEFSEDSRRLTSFNIDDYAEQARQFRQEEYELDALMAEEEGGEGISFDLSKLPGRDSITKEESQAMIQAAKDAHKSKRAKLDKLVAYERDFSQRGIEFLREDEIVAYRKLRRERIRGPVALLQLAREIPEESESRQRNLLEYLMDYDYMRFEDYAPEERIPGDAAAFILHLDLRYWNAQDFSRPETLNFSALFSVLGNMRYCLNIGDRFMLTPMDDPGDPMLYLDSEARSARQTIITWHVNTASVPVTLRRFRLEDILEEATCLGRSTTYGFFGEYARTPRLRFDLLYQLIRHGYTGFKQESGKNKDGSINYQHIWLHPDLLISVRVKDTGKFSVGVLRETPFSSNGKIKQSFLTQGAQSEVFKVSDVHLVPARYPTKGKLFSDLWEIQDDAHVRGLMATAHFRFGIIDPRPSADGAIEPPYFDFEKATPLLKPI